MAHERARRPVDTPAGSAGSQAVFNVFEKQIQSLIITADILYKGAQYKAGRAAGKIQSAHDILAVCQSKTLHAFIKKANSSSPAVPGSTARTLNKIRILTEQR